MYAAVAGHAIDAGLNANRDATWPRWPHRKRPHAPRGGRLQLDTAADVWDESPAARAGLIPDARWHDADWVVAKELAHWDTRSHEPRAARRGLSAAPGGPPVRAPLGRAPWQLGRLAEGVAGLSQPLSRCSP